MDSEWPKILGNTVRDSYRTTASPGDAGSYWVESSKHKHFKNPSLQLLPFNTQKIMSQIRKTHMCIIEIGFLTMFNTAQGGKDQLVASEFLTSP